MDKRWSGHGRLIHKPYTSTTCEYFNTYVNPKAEILRVIITSTQKDVSRFRCSRPPHSLRRQRRRRGDSGWHNKAGTRTTAVIAAATSGGDERRRSHQTQRRVLDGNL